jgi:hypothetical protein
MSTLLSREFLTIVASWAGILVVAFTTLGTVSGITYVLASSALKKLDLKDHTAVEARVVTVQSNAERGNTEAQRQPRNVALANGHAAQAHEPASEDENQDQLGITAEGESIPKQELVNSVTPRRLTEEQREALSELLRPMLGGSLAIVSPISDAEASDFAGDFDSAIRTGASWNTTRIFDHVGENQCGVFIGMVGNSSSAQIAILSRALDVIGVSHRIGELENNEFEASGNFLPQRTLFLLVGHKLQPLESRSSSTR